MQRLSRRTRACALVGLLVSVGSACVDKAPAPPPVDPAMVADNLLTAPPATLTRALDLDFVGKVTDRG
jgi:hypothetical protein